jgi:hypothetical protein
MLDSVEYETYLPNLDLEKSGLNHEMSTGTGTCKSPLCFKCHQTMISIEKKFVFTRLEYRFLMHIEVLVIKNFPVL